MLPLSNLAFDVHREVRRMQDPYQPLDSKNGYTSDDGDDKDFLLDPIFPTNVSNYDFA